MLQIVGLSGNVGRPSKTRRLVAEATLAIGAAAAGQAHIFDLSDLGPAFGLARTFDDLEPEGREIADQLVCADVLVVGSPVYKASYAGLFKHFFDLLPPDALSGKVVCLAATGGSARHALAVEHHMRPLFSFFGAITLPTALFATDRDFADDMIRCPDLRARIGAAAHEAGCLAALSPAQRLQGRSPAAAIPAIRSF